MSQTSKHLRQRSCTVAAVRQWLWHDRRRASAAFIHIKTNNTVTAKQLNSKQRVRCAKDVALLLHSGPRDRWCEYLRNSTLEIKTLHWIFSRHHVDHKTVPVTHGKTLWRSKRLCKVGPRAPHRGPATRWLTATFAMPMSGQGVSSHLADALIMTSFSSHRSDLSCTRRRTACLLSV